MKRAGQYHSVWCPVVADKWGHAPRGLFVTLLADVGARTRCQECARVLKAAGASSAQDCHLQPLPVPAPSPPEAVIPLRFVGLVHGILFLTAAPQYQERLRQTAVGPATPPLVDGWRKGMVVRIDAARATFRNGPCQVRLRPPLQRSATKPYSVDSVEPAPWA
jgi:hypothetical protein